MGLNKKSGKQALTGVVWLIITLLVFSIMVMSVSATQTVFNVTFDFKNISSFDKPISNFTLYLASDGFNVDECYNIDNPYFEEMCVMWDDKGTDATPDGNDGQNFSNEIFSGRKSFFMRNNFAYETRAIFLFKAKNDIYLSNDTRINTVANFSTTYATPLRWTLSTKSVNQGVNSGCQYAIYSSNLGLQNAVPYKICGNDISTLTSENSCDTLNFFQTVSTSKTVNSYGPNVCWKFPKTGYGLPNRYFYLGTKWDNGINALMYLDNITFTNLRNGTNFLPSVNVSVDKSSVCVNDSSDSYVHNLTITVFDPENDTVYYATDVNSDIIDTFVVEYNEKILTFKGVDGFSFNADTENTDFLSQVLTQSDSCSIDTDPNYISPNMTDFVLVEDVTTNDSVNMLGLLGSTFCGGKNSYYYKMETVSRDLLYISDFYRMSNGEGMNVTFWDGGLSEETMKVRVIKNSTGLFYANVNASGVSSYISVFDETKFRMQVRLNDSSAQYNVKFVNLTSGSSVNTTYSTYNDVLPSIVEIELDDSSGIVQNFFSYTAFVDDIDFSTVKPTQFVTTGTGSFRYRVFVTDEFHIPDDYVQKSGYVSVTRCGQYVSPNDIDQNLIDSLGLIRRTKNSLCQSFDVINKLDPTGNLNFSSCSVMKYGFLIGSFVLVMFMSLIFTLVFPQIVAGLFLILLSAVWGFGSIVFTYGTSLKLIILFMFALGMVQIILTFMYSRAGGEQQ